MELSIILTSTNAASTLINLRIGRAARAQFKHRLLKSENDNLLTYMELSSMVVTTHHVKKSCPKQSLNRQMLPLPNSDKYLLCPAVPRRTVNTIATQIMSSHSNDHRQHEMNALSKKDHTGAVGAKGEALHAGGGVVPD
jgi:hypothetical protein